MELRPAQKRDKNVLREQFNECCDFEAAGTFTAKQIRTTNAAVSWVISSACLFLYARFFKRYSMIYQKQ